MATSGLTLASQVIGFISFSFTLLTALGVYADLIRTLRGAPTTIPIALGNLREEIRWEQTLLRHRPRPADPFNVFPGKQTGRNDKSEFSRLLEDTLRHIWTQFCDIERKFLCEGEVPSSIWDRYEPTPNTVNGRNGGSYSGDEKGNSNSRQRRSRPTRPETRRQSYVRGRMGYVEAGLSRDRQNYYNTDLTHRFAWWWRKDDVKSLADQVQRLQIRRIERDAFETDRLVRRGMRIFANRERVDVFRGSSSDDDSYSDDGGNGSDGGGGGKGGGGGHQGHRRRRRRHSGGPNKTDGYNSNNNRRSRTSAPPVHGRVREVSEKEIVRRRAPSPEDSSPPPPPRHAVSVAGSRRDGPRRGSVIYEYEVVNPGGVRVEYVGSERELEREHEREQEREQDQRWREERRRSRSRPRDRERERDREHE